MPPALDIAPFRAAQPMTQIQRVTEAISVAALSLLLLLGFQLYVDNVFIVTTNGLWKSVLVREWADHPDIARIDPANALYFPVYGALVRVLDAWHVFPGLAWKQMAVLNAVFASFILGSIQYWVAATFANRRIALLTVLFYGGSGHFLTLSVINEDIMPSYFFVLLAMLLAGSWFGRPTPARIVTVAIVTSIAWLFEWRLLFPVVPPMLLALWLAAGSLRQRGARTALFLLGNSLLPLCVAFWAAIRESMDPSGAAQFFGRLFWVGKGVGTGWAGFSLAKLHLVWVGMAESVIGGRYLQSGDWIHHPANIWEVAAGSLLLAVLAVTSVRFVLGRLGDRRLVSIAIVFGGTLLAGQFFNAYSQPQDPQMQLTVMPWIIPAWAMLLTQLLRSPARVFAREASGRPIRWATPAAFALSLFPLVNTAPVIAAERGGNARYLAVLARMERQFDPDRTFFVYLGFDALIPWQFTNWSASWPDVDHLPPAPAPNPKFKWLSITDGMIWHHDWTPARHASELKRKIDHASLLGYRIVTNAILERPEQFWVETTLTIAPPEAAIAVRRMLLHDYRAEEVYSDPTEGPFFMLSPQSQPPSAVTP